MINKRLFGAPIQGKVKAKLEARQSGLGNLEQNSFNNKTPFVRMWTSLKFLSADTFLEDAEEATLDDSNPQQNSPSGKKVPMVQESRDVTKEKIVVNKTTELTMDDILNAQPKALDTTNDPDVVEDTGRQRGSIGFDALNENETNHGNASDNVRANHGVELAPDDGLGNQTPTAASQIPSDTPIMVSDPILEVTETSVKVENKISPSQIDEQFDKVVVKNPTKTTKQTVSNRKYDASRTYVIGDDNYKKMIQVVDSNTNEPITDNPDTENVNEVVEAQEAFKNIFPKESNNYEGNYLKPDAGITSVTTTTEGSLGLIKKTTVSFVVHNFYDFDKIYNRYFLKPGATIFVDFGWNTIKELYKPDDLLNHPNGIEDFLYSESNDDTEKEGIITKNQGDLETVFGLVSNYDAQVQKNGSVNCSVTITSTNAALLDSENDNKFKNKISEALEEGLYYYSLKKLSKLTKNKEDEAQFQSRYIPNIDTPDSELKAVKKGLKKEFNETFGSYNNINSLGMQFGVYAGTKDYQDTYMTWGMFEDYIINGHLGFGKNIDDINMGTNLQIRMDSSESYTSWSNIHKTVFNQRLKNNKAPDVLIPEKWGLFTHDGKEVKSYSYRKKKYPLFFLEREPLNAYLKDNNNNDLRKFGRVPIREVFIKVEMIKSAFTSKENNGIKEIVQNILTNINEETGYLFDWAMITGNTESQIKIVDQNYALNKTITEKGINWFQFDVMSPHSQIVDYNLAFKIPSGNLGDYYAILGMGHENSIFTMNDGVRKAAAALSLDLDNPSLSYQPDYEGFRAQTKLNDDIASDNSNIYDRVDDLLQTTALHTLDDYVIPPGEEVKVQHLYKKYKDATKASNNVGTETGQDIVIDYVKHNNDIMRNDGRYSVAKSYSEYLQMMCGKEVNTKGLGLLPFTLELKLNGIASILPGDTFRVNYLPNQYRKKTYLQTMRVSHDVNSDGWYTTLETQFRELLPSLKNNIFKNLDVSADSVRMSAHGYRLNPFNIRTSGIGPNLYEKTDKEFFPVKLETMQKIITDSRYDVSYSGYFDFVFDIRLANVKDVIGKEFEYELGHVPDGLANGARSKRAQYGSAGYLTYGKNLSAYNKAIQKAKDLGIVFSTWNAFSQLRNCNNRLNVKNFKGVGDGDLLYAEAVGKQVREFRSGRKKDTWTQFHGPGKIYYLNISLGNAYLASGYRYKLVIKNGRYGLIGPYLNDNESPDSGMKVLGGGEKGVLKTKDRVDAILDFYNWVADNDDGLNDNGNLEFVQYWTDDGERLFPNE